MRFFLKKIKLISSLLTVWMLVCSVACQLKPTKVYETQPTQKKESAVDKTKEIPTETVIIDVRPNFEYQLTHINGALSMQWSDFTEREAPLLGLLEKDLFFHARKLARMGISPNTPVIVVGKGLQGVGEEGRLAWTLSMLGLKNVKVASIDLFEVPLTSAPAAPREAKPIWKPDVDESLVISKKQFLKIIRTPKVDPNSPVIIDVRSEAEYLGKASTQFSRAPDIGTMNVEWKEFFTRAGEPNKAIIERLEAVGIHRERPVILISEKGVRSGAATWALRQLGYSKATNFAGGYMQLLSK